MRGEVTGAAEALRRPAIRRVLAAFACLMAGEWAVIAALSFHAYRVGGALAVGLLGLRFVPGAATGLVAPRLIEQRQPTRVLRAVAGGRALLIGAIAAAVALGLPYAVVLAVLAADGAIAAVYRPAQSALLPSLAATPGELTAGAGLLGNVKTVAQVAGASIGGVLVVASSTAAVAGGAAILMGLGALVVPRRAARAKALADTKSPHVARMRRGALNVAALATVRSLVRGLWLAMVVVAAIRLIGLGASGVGILMAASAAGALVALPIAIGLFGSGRLAIALGVALAAAGAPLALLAAWHAPGVALALVGLHGLGMAVAEAASLGLLHRLLDARGVASIVGPMESSKLALEGAGSLLAPALIALAGTRGALAIAGVFPVVLVALDWRTLGHIDAAAGARTKLVVLLRDVDIFRGLPLAGLEDLATGAERREFADGEVVIQQGDPGDTFYVVGSGRAEVLIDGFPVAVLGRGMGFGERALLRGGQRAATVRAHGELEVVVVSRDLFLAAVAGGQQVLATDAAAPARSLPDLLPSLPLFARLPRPVLERALDRFALEEFAADTEIVRQGERGDCCYVLLEGTADVLVDGEAVALLMAGDSFGEIALLHDVPRRATVRARDPVRVAALGRDAFSELIPIADPPLVA
jgi:CRP-like cAMP-binding protein